jgi:hypothetical protein
MSSVRPNGTVPDGHDCSRLQAYRPVQWRALGGRLAVPQTISLVTQRVFLMFALIERTFLCDALPIDWRRGFGRPPWRR